MDWKEFFEREKLEKQKAKFLFCAIQENNPINVQTALDWGVNISVRDPETGNTVLIEAVINLGKNKKNETEFEVALSIFKEFVEIHGMQIDFGAKNKKGKTAAMIAKKYKMPRVQLLIEEGVRFDGETKYVLSRNREDNIDGLRVTRKLDFCQ